MHKHAFLKCAVLAAGAAVPLTFAVPAGASAIVDITNSMDAGMFSEATSSSLSLPGFFVGTDGGDSPKRGLLQFDLSSIPAGATIDSVTLSLSVGQVAGSAGGAVTNFGPLRNISLYNETQAWNQSTNKSNVTYGSNAFGGSGHGVTANAGDATWTDEHYDASNPTAWNVAAGGNWTSASVALAHATNIPGTTGEVVSWSSAALAAEVQGWLDDPSTNHGLLVKNDDETTGTDFLAFWGEQGAINEGNPSLAPDLQVTYDASPVPEPMTLSLIALAMPALLRRRRRAAGV